MDNTDQTAGGDPSESSTDAKAEPTDCKPVAKPVMTKSSSGMSNGARLNGAADHGPKMERLTLVKQKHELMFAAAQLDKVGKPWRWVSVKGNLGYIETHWANTGPDIGGADLSQLETSFEESPYTHIRDDRDHTRFKTYKDEMLHKVGEIFAVLRHGKLRWSPGGRSGPFFMTPDEAAAELEATA